MSEVQTPASLYVNLESCAYPPKMLELDSGRPPARLKNLHASSSLVDPELAINSKKPKFKELYGYVSLGAQSVKRGVVPLGFPLNQPQKEVPGPASGIWLRAGKRLPVLELPEANT